MRDEFTNRIRSFKTPLTTLNKAENKTVWFNQPPVVFTAKVADAAQAVTDLEAFCTAQETAITGPAQQKAREAAEAVEVTFQMARALVEWFRAQGDETNAAKMDLSRSKWHGCPALSGHEFSDVGWIRRKKERGSRINWM